jgi:hypothetical protein
VSPRVLAFVVAVASLHIVGCSGCRKGESVSGQPSPASASAVPTQSPAPVAAQEPREDALHGLWSQRPFLARSALISLHPHWLTVTLLDREARCDSARLVESDLGIQMTIPSGPRNDFFAGQDIPLEIRLHGAGGVSRIPPGHVTVRIQPFRPEHDDTVRGFLSFRFRTATDSDAPSYASEGVFTARVCNNRATVPSVRALPMGESSVSGTVAGRAVRLTSMLAYTRDDGYGSPIVMLKGFEGDVVCHTTRSATPYLFGAEVGAGRAGKYFQGAALPAEWQMQMRMFQFSERSVQAAHGAGWVQIDSIDLKEGGVVRGRLGADNPDDDAEWRFTLSGQFEAKVCGVERRAW